MEDNYPCFMGRFSLSGAPLPDGPEPRNPDHEPLLIRPQVTVVACGLHEMPSLDYARTDDEFALLLGDRTSQLAGGFRAAERPDAFLKWSRTAGPERSHGSFVSLHVAWHAPGEYEARFTTDKYGFRTLYYYQADDVLFFASHLSGLTHQLNGALPGISPRAFLHYYHFGITPSETTLIDGVKKVPAASMLTVTPGKVRISPYFDPLDLYEPERYAHADAATISRDIDACMTHAVARRIADGGQIGLALSGGVDSGYIARKLKEAGADFKGYNLAYGDYDEHDRVDRLGKSLGIEVERVCITVPEIIDSFLTANRLGSEPVIFNDAALRILAQRARRDGVHRIWDGDGADRLFLGMNGHLKYQRVFMLHQILKKTHLVKPFAQILQWLERPEARKLSTVLQGWSNGIPPYSERKYGAIKGYDEVFEQQIFELGVEAFWKTYRRRVETLDLGLFLTYFSIKKCPENFFHTPIEQQWYLGLQPVSPYWDDAVVSSALSVPSHMKLRKAKTKYVLRKAAALESDSTYWMLPKIGLQNALPCIRASEMGRQWLAKQRAKIVNTSEYRFLAEVVNEPEPDADRLLPYLHWKEAHLGATASFVQDSSMLQAAV